MRPDVSSLGEALAALVALVRPFASVTAFVCLEQREVLAPWSRLGLKGFNVTYPQITKLGEPVTTVGLLTDLCAG